MIYRLTLKQVSIHWNLIKLAGMSAESIEKEMQAKYFIDLMCEIYAGSAVVFMSVYEEVIHRVFICSVMKNKYNNDNTLQVRAMYSFQSMDDKVKVEFQQMVQWAKKEFCCSITATTNNDKMISFATSLNLKEIERTYQLDIGD
jgi:hypothetical protein